MIKTALFIHHGASLGGAPNSLFEILKRIDKKKCRVIVILPQEGPFSDLLQEEGIEFRVIPLFVFYYCSQAKSFSAKNLPMLIMSIKKLFTLFFNLLGNAVYLPKVLRKENPDVVVINCSTLLLSGIIAKIMKKRVVWHVREVISTEKSKTLKKIIAAIFNFSAEKIIVNSRFSFNDMLNLKVKKNVLVYNGVDLNKFCTKSVPDEKFTEFGLSSNDKIVGFVGQIYKEKGWFNLVKAAFLLIQKMPSLKFLIVGSGYMIERKGVTRFGSLKNYGEDVLFQQIVKDMKLENNFIFLGQRFDIENILPLMSCVVVPRIAPETFGRVIIEATALGLPVIASNIGATSEIVIDGITGILIEPDNPKALSKALMEILTDEEKVKKIGNAARKRTEELFDIEKILPQILEVYNI